MRLRQALVRRRRGPDIRVSLERNMRCGVALCGHCQLGPLLLCRDGPVVSYAEAAPLAGLKGAVMTRRRQAQAGRVEAGVLRRLPAHPARLRGRAARGGRRRRDRALHRGIERGGRRAVRRVPGGGVGDHRAGRPPDQARSGRRPGCWSRIGACATAGGIQALRNFADVGGVHLGGVRAARVHLDPGHLDAGVRSRHGRLRAAGLPDRQAPAARAADRAAGGPQAPDPAHSVCHDCKLRGTSCVMVAQGTPCLGPITQAGCGAICPAFGRGCYGCFGPVAAPNLTALTAQLRHLGMTEAEVNRVFATFNAAAPGLASARGE